MWKKKQKKYNKNLIKCELHMNYTNSINVIEWNISRKSINDKLTIWLNIFNNWEEQIKTVDSTCFWVL